MSYAVLQTEVVEPSSEQLCRAFSAVPGLTDHDATQRARNATGLLGQHLSHAEAWALFEALAVEGIAASIVEDSELPTLPTGFSLRQVDCLDNGLVVYDALGRSSELTWGQVQLVAAGLVSKSQFKTQRQLKNTPLSAVTVVVVDKHTEEYKDLRCLVEIYVDVEPYRFRIDAIQLRCPYLGASAPPNAQQRIEMVVRDLLRLAPHALVNRGADTLIRSGEQRIYRSPQIFEREIVWLQWIAQEAMG